MKRSINIVAVCNVKVILFVILLAHHCCSQTLNKPTTWSSLEKQLNELRMIRGFTVITISQICSGENGDFNQPSHSIS